MKKDYLRFRRLSIFISLLLKSANTRSIRAVRVPYAEIGYQKTFSQAPKGMSSTDVFSTFLMDIDCILNCLKRLSAIFLEAEIRRDKTKCGLTTTDISQALPQNAGVGRYI